MAALPIVVAILVTLSLLTAACSGKAEAPGGSAALKVNLKEWRIDLNQGSVPSGPIDFEITNGGRIGHEVVVVRSDLPEKALPSHGGIVDTNTAGQTVRVIKDVRPGRRVHQSLDLPPGKYVLICNIVGHYQLGMVAALEAR